MIRFIEKQGEQLIYKSGGGITIDSDVTRANQFSERLYIAFPD